MSSSSQIISHYQDLFTSFDFPFGPQSRIQPTQEQAENQHAPPPIPPRPPSPAAVQDIPSHLSSYKQHCLSFPISVLSPCTPALSPHSSRSAATEKLASPDPSSPPSQQPTAGSGAPRAVAAPALVEPTRGGDHGVYRCVRAAPGRRGRRSTQLQARGPVLDHQSTRYLRRRRPPESVLAVRLRISHPSRCCTQETP